MLGAELFAAGRGQRGFQDESLPRFDFYFPGQIEPVQPPDVVPVLLYGFQ